MTSIDTPALPRDASTLPSRPAISPTLVALRQFCRSPSGVAGAAVLLILVLTTVFGPHFYGIGPLDLVDAPFTPPGEDAWLGTDYLGRDILAGLIHGGRATLTVGGVAAIITIAIGVPSVRPSKTPDKISQRSASLRSVTRLLCPGRRRSRSR